jgi:hypothetical protein
MEEFGTQVAEFLDDFFTESTPMSIHDSKIGEIVDFIFDKTMDGSLLKFHKVDESRKLPKRYSSIEQVLLNMDTAHCSKPVYLAKAVSKFGVSEARGCTLVSEAIEKMLLTLCEEHEIPDSDIDLARFLESVDKVKK